MSEPEKLNLPPPGGDPDPLVVALRELRPALVAVNRDGLMYAAGAESRRGVVRLWQAAAGFMAAVGFAAGMFMRPGGIQPEKQIVYVPVPAPATALPEPALVPDPTPEPAAVLTQRASPPTAYARAWLKFRSDMLTLGLSVLPAPPPENQ